MHELSIAQSLIELASEAAIKEGATRVTRLVTRIGKLAGVVEEALQFSFTLAAEGTACEDAVLTVEVVDISVMCPECREPRALSETYHFVCPVCGAPTPEVLTGRELDLVSVEIESYAAANP
jgi:hydrogenase nickel incorporation protein HypA/HybF